MVPELADPEPPLDVNPLLDVEDEMEDEDCRVQVPSGSFVQPLPPTPSEDRSELSTLSLWKLVEVLVRPLLPPPAAATDSELAEAASESEDRLDWEPEAVVRPPAVPE